MQQKSTKSIIIKAAEELILSYGYHGFSYNDIAKIVNIRKSSIHYHFPAKEDLGLAFINKFRRLFKLWTKRLGSLSNKKKISAFCLMYSRLSCEGTRICPIGMVAAEYHTMPATIQTNTQELILMVEQWLETIIKLGISTSEFKENLDPRETAREIIHIMSGALKMARIFKDTTRIDDAKQILEKHIFNERDNKGENY